MSKFYLLQNSFRSGEFGPRLLGRTDTQEYRDSAELIENFVPIVQGGLNRRMGSKYVFSTISRPAIIPFVFSKTEGFAILLNHDGSDPTVIDKDGQLQKVVLSDQTIGNYTLVNWEFLKDLDPNGWHHTQIGDVIVLVHNSSELPPIVIKREEDSLEGIIFVFEWYLLPEDMGQYDKTQILRWPFKPINIDDSWLQIGGAVNLIEHTITARDSQNQTAPPIKNFWSEDEAGSLIRIVPYNDIDAPGAIEFVFRIDGILDDGGLSDEGFSSIAQTTIIFPSQYPTSIPDPSISRYMTKDWKAAAWSGAAGWPKSVSAFEQRLFFGGAKNSPDTLWGSLTGNIFHMMKERLEQDKNVADKQDDVSRLNYFGVEVGTDPLELIPAAAEVNKIQWLHGGNALMVGTIGAEYILTGGNAALASDNLNFRRQTVVGSSPIQTTSLKNNVFYISRTGRAMYDLVTDPVDLVSETRNLNTLNEDIITHQSSNLQQIVQVVSQTATDTIWCLTDAKALIGFTLNETSGVRAWHRHVLGGRDAKVISLGIIPNEVGTFDDLWLAVERFGVGVKQIRTTELDPGTDIVDVGTGFRFLNLPVQSKPLDFLLAKYPEIPRRFVLKIPNDFDINNLNNKYFIIGDREEWDVWFTDGTGAPPANLNRFCIPVTFDTSFTDQQLVDAINTELSNEIGALAIEAHAIGVTVTNAGGLKPHFNIAVAEGTPSTKMLALIEIIPAGSFGADIGNNIVANNEYFYLATPNKEYRVYFGEVDPDPGGPETPVQVTVNMGDNQRQVMESLASALEAVIFATPAPDDDETEFTVTRLNAFDSRSGYESIERIGENFSNDLMFNESDNEADKPYFSDSSKRVELSTPDILFPGFEHLSGENVQVLADGFDVGERLVTDNGEIILDVPAEEIIAGYKYTSKVKTFPIEVGGDFGSTVGVLQRIDRVTAIFFKTFGARFGYDLNYLEEIEFLPPEYNIGDPLPLYTGRQQVYFPASPDDLQFVIIEQSKPLPCTVVAIAMRGRSYDSSQ